MFEIYDSISSVWGYFKFLGMVFVVLASWMMMCRFATRAYFEEVVLKIIVAQQLPPMSDDEGEDDDTDGKQQLNG
jgi:hypothetical protein